MSSQATAKYYVYGYTEHRGEWTRELLVSVGEDEHLESVVAREKSDNIFGPNRLRYDIIKVITENVVTEYSFSVKADVWEEGDE